MASDGIVSTTKTKVIIKIDRIGEVLSPHEAIVFRTLVKKMKNHKEGAVK